MGASRKGRWIAGGLGFLVLWTLSACGSGPGGAARGSATSGGAGGSAAYAPLGDPGAGPGRATASQPGDRPSPQAAESVAHRPARTGPEIRVTWEALAVERERFANPRVERRQQRGVLHMQRVVLVNESHSEAKANRSGRATRQNVGVAVAALPDADMVAFVRGLERRGFFRLARPTSGVQHLFDGESARGRITVERGGESVTLLSLRGQGLNPATKAIPAMYSEVKQAVLVLRNQTPTLGVVSIERGSISR